VKEGVSETVNDTVLDGVFDGVNEGVCETVKLGVAETVREGVIDTVKLGVALADGVLLGVKDTVRDGVAEGVFDAPPLASGNSGNAAFVQSTAMQSNRPLTFAVISDPPVFPILSMLQEDAPPKFCVTVDPICAQVVGL
jgi:hypothetical protein